jgi:hypothetical protein
MNKIITTNSKSGNMMTPQFDETKFADTFTIEEAKDNLFLKQQAITRIRKAKRRNPTARSIRVVSLAIRAWEVEPCWREGIRIR